MISFEDAREIVRAALLPEWSDPEGTFFVADWGSENEQYYCLAVGAREYLVDNDRSYFIVDNTLNLVEKSTGKYLTVPASENLDLMASLTPIGVAPPQSEFDPDFMEFELGPTQEEFEDILQAAIRGEVRTCTGLSEATTEVLERISQASPSAPPELILLARQMYMDSQ